MDFKKRRIRSVEMVGLMRYDFSLLKRTKKMKLWLFWAFLGLLRGGSTAVWAQPQVNFQIDLRGAIQAGWFDPKTEQVGLRGGTAPLSWGASVPLQDSDGDGWYEASISFALAPETLQRIVYKVRVEGTQNPNEGWESGKNHWFILEKAGQTIRRAFNDPPALSVPTFTGSVETHKNFQSKHVAARDLFVYLPPQYAQQPKRRFPVLYLHDGRNVFDASIIDQEWQVDETAERLIKAGEIEPVIIVGINNTAQRIWEYTPDSISFPPQFTLHKTEPSPNVDGSYNGLHRIRAWQKGEEVWIQADFEETYAPAQALGNQMFRYEGRVVKMTLQFNHDEKGMIIGATASDVTVGGGGAAYGKMLVEEIKPFIDRTYRTRREATATSVGGSSLGGLISLYLGLTYPKVFGGLWVVSPSVWWNGQSILNQVKAAPLAPKQRIWLDMGTGEGQTMLAGSQRLAAVLREKGIKATQFSYREYANAQHNETAWAQRVSDMLRFLYAPKTPN